MSQPQMQHKPSTVNGLNRRRGDRDLGNRSENFRNDYHKYRPFRQGSSNITATEGLGSGQHLSSSSSDSISQTVPAAAKSSGDKAEMLTQGENRDGGQRPSQGLLVLTACLVGQPVEVQVKNGSIYSGVFHTASAEKDYAFFETGIVLRMARIVRDTTLKGVSGDGGKELARRPTPQLLISADELVQIVAKEVPVSGECLQNGRCRENRTEIVTDSFISQGRHGEKERELKPWTPDDDDPKELGLETTFQNTWNRNWDQFEINKTLFGVESTFDEELYTTKLERGPQMREREREAWRIAREIEGENTKNLHLAEERGVGLSKNFDQLDEESRYSSVLRAVDDIGDDNDDFNIDLQNDVTFGEAPAGIDDDVTSARAQPSSITDEPDRNLLNKHTDPNEPSDSLNKEVRAKEGASSSVDPPTPSLDILNPVPKERVTQINDWNKRGIKVLPSQLTPSLVADTTSIQALNLDPGCPQVTEDVYREFNEFKLQESAKRGKKQREDQVNELKSFSESLKDLTPKSTTGGGSRKMNASACAPPASALPIPTNITHSVGANSSSESTSSHNVVESTKAPDGSVTLPESASTSGTHMSLQSSDTRISTLNSVPSAATPSSPSSTGISASGDSTKKSTLNPNAKEFKLNPNAKSFTPSFTPLRPPSPVVQGSVYVPGVVPPVAPVQAFPVNPLLQPPGQPGTKYPPYSPATPPYMPAPGSYTPVTGTTMPSTIGAAGQTPVKVMPQIQPPAGGHSFTSSQQQVRYSSQSSPVQPTSTYIHPSGPLYSQQMLFGQPGPVVYLQPYIQGPPLPPPQTVPTTGQQQQPKHRGPVY